MKLPTILIIFCLLLTIGVVLGFVYRDSFKVTTSGIVTDTKNRDKPKFVFDNAKFPDWVTSGNAYHDEASEDRSPHTIMLVSQCEVGSRCSELMNEALMEDKCRTSSKQQCEKLQRFTDVGHCTVYAYYHSGSINLDAATKDQLKQLSGLGNTPHQVGTKTLSINTTEGDKEYQLHQYDTGNSDNTHRRGVAFGLVPLNDGHIEVRSICWEASQLEHTLPVLSAIGLVT